MHTPILLRYHRIIIPSGIFDDNSHYILLKIHRFLLREMATWKMRTLDEIMETLGHQNKEIDVLKMDIEGDEWDVLEDIIDKGLFKVTLNLKKCLSRRVESFIQFQSTIM